MLLAQAVAFSSENSSHKRERRKDARPTELLDAALDLFVERGYSATRAEEVAQRAGVSKGTLFLYFPSKAELFKAMVRQSVTSHYAHWREGLAEFPGSVAAALHLVAQGWWLHVGSTKACGITKLMVAEGFNFPEVAQFYQDEVIVPGNQMLMGLLKSGVEKGEFRADVPLLDAMHSFLSALFFLSCTKHVLPGSSAAGLQIDPSGFLFSHVSTVLHHLCIDPRAPAKAKAEGQDYVNQLRSKNGLCDETRPTGLLVPPTH